MTEVSATRKIKSASIQAVVTRADGTVEHLGTISYWHQNPLRRLLWRLTHPRS